MCVCVYVFAVLESRLVKSLQIKNSGSLYLCTQPSVKDKLCKRLQLESGGKMVNQPHFSSPEV